MDAERQRLAEGDAQADAGAMAWRALGRFR
jgi:hypothetical protein